MDQFNVHSKDFKNFDRYMDLKKPSFGGPNETEPFAGSKRKSLKGYTRIVKRDPNFEMGGSNPNYDGSWYAVNHDRVSRDAKVKPVQPRKAIPTYGSVSVKESYMGSEDFGDLPGSEYGQEYMEGYSNCCGAKIVMPDICEYCGEHCEVDTDIPYNEGRIFLFEEFVTEADDDLMDSDITDKDAPEIDEDLLEDFISEFGDDIREILEIACEKMDIGQDECLEIFKAALDEIAEMPKEEQDDEDFKDDMLDTDPIDED